MAHNKSSLAENPLKQKILSALVLILAKYMYITRLHYIFPGELGKLEMLHEGILHRCIKQLLDKKKNVSVAEMAEDLECLCQIMTTVGQRLDTPKAKVRGKWTVLQLGFEKGRAD